MPKAERDIAKSDYKPSKKVKKTRAKAKNVSQTVIVNVGRRGGSKAPSTAPPRPTPLQQALQFVQATRPPQQGESLIQSTQVLQRMLEPINRRLDTLMGQPSQPAINFPPINIGQPAINFPPINITQPAINVSQPPINITQPAINIAQPMPQPMVKPQASMASQTEMIPMQSAPLQGGIKPFPPYQLPSAPLSYHDFVLDLPDAPLVKPPLPLVPAGSLRLDPEYEDVPVVDADEKEQERPRKPIIGDEEPPNPFADIPLTQEALDKLVYKRKGNTSANTITLIELARYYGLTLPRSVMDGGKQSLINYLIAEKGAK